MSFGALFIAKGMIRITAITGYGSLTTPVATIRIVKHVHFWRISYKLFYRLVDHVNAVCQHLQLNHVRHGLSLLHISHDLAAIPIDTLDPFILVKVSPVYDVEDDT